MTTFLQRFRAAFLKLFGQASTWIHDGQAIVTFATPVALGILAAIDPAAGAIAIPIAAEIQSDLATAAVIVGDGQSPNTLGIVLNRVATNMQGLLAAGRIKNPAIVNDVTVVIGEINALVTELVPPKPAAK